MAIEYTSSPVAHPACQIRISGYSRKTGMTVSRKALKTRVTEHLRYIYRKIIQYLL